MEAKLYFASHCLLLMFANMLGERLIYDADQFKQYTGF